MTFLKVVMGFALLLALLSSVRSYVITIPPRSQECFFEELQFKERMLATYEVVSGGMLDVNVRVTGPDGKVVYEQEREKDGSVQFFALTRGAYQICFSNAMSTMTSKMLSFNIYSGSELHRIQNAKNDSVEPLDKAVMAVTESVRKLTDTYSYLRTRIFACQWTVESTSDSVWLYGSINIVLAIAALFLRTVFIVKPFNAKPAGMPQHMGGYGGQPRPSSQMYGI